MRSDAEATLAGSVPVEMPTRPVDELLHELRVHQIELEMQNEALRQTQTELEASHGRYVDLYEFAPLGYLTLSRTGIIEQINLAAATLLGGERGKLLGARFAGFVVEEDRDRWYRHQLQVMRQCEKQRCEIALQRGTGQICHVQADCLRVTAGDASPTLRIALTDVSERRQTEERLREAKEEAERANSAKTRFLAAASHDLRQPLSALSLYADVLGATAMPSAQKVVASMKDCIGSLSSLLTDLLDMSKLEAGVVTPTIDDFPIAEILASLEAANTLEAQFKGLQLRCRLPTGMTARSDPVLLRRILANLINNAIRFTEHGGVLVACRRGQGKTWVEVWDTGIGIPADKTAEIFEEFKQLGDQARNKGSGLGLAIVAKTAAVLGLEIKVRSRPGRGSVFAIELPLGQAARAKTLAARSSAGRRVLRIALVDDNAMVRSALDLGLQSLGHQVVAAHSKATLLEALGTLAPDIVVADYRLLQGETGFDVIAAVRKQWAATLPAILITGDTAPGVVRSMTERGIVVLHKPVALETVQKCVEDLTRARLFAAD